VADKARLKKDLVVWLVTADHQCRPHSVLVWFYWDGESFLVYSLPGQKVRGVQANPNVELHLNSDLVGDDVVRISGTAKIARKEPPAYKVPGYVRKYRSQMKNLGMTPQQFSEQYSVPIRIRPTRFH